MWTATRFVFLMHPKEFKQEKAATGRLTHLALADSEIHVGVRQQPQHRAVTISVGKRCFRLIVERQHSHPRSKHRHRGTRDNQNEQ